MQQQRITDLLADKQKLIKFADKIQQFSNREILLHQKHKN